MVTAKVFVLQKKFEGVPKNDDVKIVEEELPSIKDGEFLPQALFISVDPFIRAYTDKLSVGSQIIGIQVAKIIESKNSKFPIGKNVIGFFGWRTHTISDGTHKEKDKIPRLVDADLGNLSVSNTLGVLGRPGFSAYFGFLDICQPKEGDVVVVSGAAGAVGHLVGQIAKIKGCSKVIGIVGSDEKGRWLINDLGFDHFINYKTEQDINAVLRKLAPDGVDCYFDNVGGEISSAVIHNLKMRGRVSLCGAISQYNEKEVPMVTSTLFPIYTRRIRIEGFLCARFVDRWTEAFNQNLEWIKEGKLKTKERVTEGFENTFQAFVEMLNGQNLGKAVVKV